MRKTPKTQEEHIYVEYARKGHTHTPPPTPSGLEIQMVIFTKLPHAQNLKCQGKSSMGKECTWELGAKVSKGMRRKTACYWALIITMSSRTQGRNHLTAGAWCSCIHPHTIQEPGDRKAVHIVGACQEKHIRASFFPSALYCLAFSWQLQKKSTYRTHLCSHTVNNEGALGTGRQ